MIRNNTSICYTKSCLKNAILFLASQFIPHRACADFRTSAHRNQTMCPIACLNRVFRISKDTSSIQAGKIQPCSHTLLDRYVIIPATISSSSSWSHADCTELPDTLSPSLPIIYRSWLVSDVASCIYKVNVFAGQPTLVRSCVEVYKRTSLLSLSLLLQ